jgi:U3 small nucleolar RNA-associated protein 12
VWSLVALPDGSGFVSCSADHDVKFWEWELVAAEVPTGGAAAGAAGAARRLAARHVRTLKMADDILCARVSPDGRLLALSLLDSTIQARASSLSCPALGGPFWGGGESLFRSHGHAF